MKKRVCVGPVIGDEATLTRSADETKAEYTLFQNEVAPDGVNSLMSNCRQVLTLDLLENLTLI